MQPISAPDAIVQTIMQTISGSPIISLCVILFAGFGVWVLIEHLRQPPRFDPTRHLEHPPVEHRPQGSLPPASAYREWEREQDKEKDGVPWN